MNKFESLLKALKEVATDLGSNNTVDHINELLSNEKLLTEGDSDTSTDY